MRRISVLLAMFAAVAYIAQPTNADIIYGDGSPDLDGAYGYDSELANADRFDQQISSEFVLGGASTITDVHWWGFYAADTTTDLIAIDDFSIRIFADTGSGPEVNPTLLDINVGSVSRVDTGLASSFGGNIFSYSVDIAPVALTTGTTYHISIVNHTVGDLDDWVWALTGGSTAVWERDFDGESWVGPYNDEMAFYLTNDNAPIPEPATLSLLGMGVVGLIARSRRSKS